MPLFTCKIEFDMVVYAPNAKKAEEVAAAHAGQEIDNVDWPVVSAEEITNEKKIPAGWNNSIPWGEKEDRTVEDIFGAEGADV